MMGRRARKGHMPLRPVRISPVMRACTSMTVRLHGEQSTSTHGSNEGVLDEQHLRILKATPAQGLEEYNNQLAVLSCPSSPSLHVVRVHEEKTSRFQTHNAPRSPLHSPHTPPAAAKHPTGEGEF